MGKTCYEIFTHYLAYFYSADKDKRSIEKAKVLFSKQEIVDVGIRILSGLGWTFDLVELSMGVIVHSKICFFFYTFRSWGCT